MDFYIFLLVSGSLIATDCLYISYKCHSSSIRLSKIFACFINDFFFIKSQPFGKRSKNIFTFLLFTNIIDKTFNTAVLKFLSSQRLHVGHLIRVYVYFKYVYVYFKYVYVFHTINVYLPFVKTALKQVCNSLKTNKSWSLSLRHDSTSKTKLTKAFNENFKLLK